jgi:hypothetical protein
MGNYIYSQKTQRFLGDKFEISSGILGVKRDTLMSLVDLMIFRKNSLIRNVFLFFICILFFLVDRNEWRKCVLDESFSFCSGTNEPCVKDILKDI